MAKIVQEIGHAAKHALKTDPHSPLKTVQGVAADAPLRAQALQRGIDITCGSRNEAYGDPLDNFTAIGALKASFWEHVKSSPNASYIQQNSAIGHAFDMVFNNLGRIASAPNLEAALSDDRYVDGITYYAIAFELMKRTLDPLEAKASA
jgi:hypothetical protein